MHAFARKATSGWHTLVPRLGKEAGRTCWPRAGQGAAACYPLPPAPVHRNAMRERTAGTSPTPPSTLAPCVPWHVGEPLEPPGCLAWLQALCAASRMAREPEPCTSTRRCSCWCCCWCVADVVPCSSVALAEMCCAQRHTGVTNQPRHCKCHHATGLCLCMHLHVKPHPADTLWQRRGRGHADRTWRMQGMLLVPFSYCNLRCRPCIPG